MKIENEENYKSDVLNVTRRHTNTSPTQRRQNCFCPEKMHGTVSVLVGCLHVILCVCFDVHPKAWTLYSACMFWKVFSSVEQGQIICLPCSPEPGLPGLWGTKTWTRFVEPEEKKVMWPNKSEADLLNAAKLAEKRLW